MSDSMRPGLPINLQCNPIESIFGFPFLPSQPVPIDELARLCQHDFRATVGLDSEDG